MYFLRHGYLYLLQEKYQFATVLIINFVATADLQILVFALHPKGQDLFCALWYMWFVNRGPWWTFLIFAEEVLLIPTKMLLHVAPLDGR